MVTPPGVAPELGVGVSGCGCPSGAGTHNSPATRPATAASTASSAPKAGPWFACGNMNLGGRMKPSSSAA
jgi:hypothetical protein